MAADSTLQAASVDATADRALLVTQDSQAVMHSSVIALPSGHVITRFTATGIPSSHNLDVGVIAEDGKTAAYAVGDHTMAVYSMADGVRLRTFDVHFSGPAGDRHRVSPIAFAPDGRLIVLGFDTYQSLVIQGGRPGGPPEDQLVGLVDVEHGRLDGQIGGFGEQSYIDAVDWSPDHRRVAIGTVAGTIRVVDALKLAPISPAVHVVAGAVQSISFAPDGKTVVTGGDNGTLAFWDSRTLQQIGMAIRGVRDDSWWAFYRGDGTVTGYAPSPVDGKEQWFTLPAQPEAWLSAACRVAGDRLTRAEWTQAVGANRPYQRVC